MHTYHLLRSRLERRLLQHRSLSSTASTITNHWITQAPNYESLQATQSPGTFRLAVKDNISTNTLPTTCASRILANYTAPSPATIIRQLTALGGQIVGTTNMDEFGMGSHSIYSAHGPVRNPLSGRQEHSAGGSSGGSAVAVALGEADIALGTDTGGSVRLPAAYCGVVGVKPSYGMLSRHGVIPYANSLDTVGLFAPSIDPLYNLLLPSGLSTTHDPLDPTSHSISSRKSFTTAPYSEPPPSSIDLILPEAKSLTIGIPLEYNILELDPLIRSTWIRAAETLSAWGARVVPVSLPSTRHALSAYYVLAPAEASSNLAKYDGIRYGSRAPGVTSDSANGTLYSETRGQLFGAEVQRRLLVGAYSLSDAGMTTYFMQAQRVRRLIQRDFDRVFLRVNPLHAGTGDDVLARYDGSPEYDLSDLDERIPLDDKRGPAQVDFILAPTAPTFPPELSEVEKMEPTAAYANDVFTVPASLAGLPAVSVPVGVVGAGQREKEVEGFKVGLQIIGQFWDDARVLGMAKKVMEVMA